MGNLQSIGLENLVTERFLDRTASEDGDRISLLRWAYNAGKDSDLPLIAELMHFVDGMHCINRTDAFSTQVGLSAVHPAILNQDFKTGLERFLNVMGYDYRLRLHQGLDRSQKLYFDLETPILFYENASSGIRALADLYARLYTTMSHASFLYLDEFDAFYNYQLS